MLPGSAAARLSRSGARSYSVYGARLAWAEPAPAPLAFPLPEVDEADRLVQSRSHLQSDRALSSLNRALQIVERIPTASALSESVLSRIAFIHQERGDYSAEDAALSAALKLNPARGGLWRGGQAVARYRQTGSFYELQERSLRDLAIDAVLRRSPMTILNAMNQDKQDQHDPSSGWILLSNIFRKFCRSWDFFEPEHSLVNLCAMFGAA